MVTLAIDAKAWCWCFCGQATELGEHLQGGARAIQPGVVLALRDSVVIDFELLVLWSLVTYIGVQVRKCITTDSVAYWRHFAQR